MAVAATIDDVNAAIAAAVAPLNDQITTLQSKVSDLEAKVTGPQQPPAPVGGAPSAGPALPAEPVQPGSSGA